MSRSVEIQFDCLPLRSVQRVDIPLDASPVYRAFCESVKTAIERHGAYNAYYLHNAVCVFRLTNDDQQGLLRYKFSGTVLTDEEDARVKSTDLEIEMTEDACDWLTKSAMDWMKETVERAVRVEFDLYIQAGDLEQAKERVRSIQDASNAAGGFIGMDV